MNIDMVGPAMALGLACLGSSIGCGIAGMASHAAMSRTEEGHGKLIALSAAPSSQAIYGFFLMLFLKQGLEAGTLAPFGAIAIGVASGTAIMISAIFQGRVCASGIEASLKHPEVYGKCFVAIGIIESFALFAFIFAKMIM